MNIGEDAKCFMSHSDGGCSKQIWKANKNCRIPNFKL